MTTLDYVLYVFCGLASFLPFSNALSTGVLSLVANKTVLLNTIFPAELIPLRSVMVASVGLPVSVAILFVADVLISDPSWSFLLVPVVMLLQLMFVAGVAWILSLLALLVRDIQHLIYYVTMMLMILTPIAYTQAMIPPSLQVVIYLNPVSYYVLSLQSLIILNELPSIGVIVAMVSISLATFVAGFNMCRSARGSFYDYA